MAMQRSSCWRRVVAVGALVAVGWTGGFANAGEGFYAGLAVGREHAGVDYRKSAGVDVAPASHMEAGDDASAGVNALKLSLGYRWALAERFYLSTELEAALYANERVRGFLRGTGVGDRDVWPGAWTLEKSRGVGLNVRVGYAPEALGFLGAGRSVYLVAGVQRLGGAIEAAPGNGVFSGTRAEEFTGAAAAPSIIFLIAPGELASAAANPSMTAAANSPVRGSCISSRLEASSQMSRAAFSPILASLARILAAEVSTEPNTLIHHEILDNQRNGIFELSGRRKLIE